MPETWAMPRDLSRWIVLLMFLGAGCEFGGAYRPLDPGPGGDTGGSGDALVKQEFESDVVPILAQMCDACHKTGAGNSPIFTAPDPDVYSAVVKYTPALLSCATPEQSHLIVYATAGSDHTGTNFTADQIPVVTEWAQLYAAMSSNCGGGAGDTPDAAPMMDAGL